MARARAAHQAAAGDVRFATRSPAYSRDRPTSRPSCTSYGRYFLRRPAELSGRCSKPAIHPQILAATGDDVPVKRSGIISIAPKVVMRPRDLPLDNPLSQGRRDVHFAATSRPNGAVQSTHRRARMPAQAHRAGGSSSPIHGHEKRIDD